MANMSYCRFENTLTDLQDCSKYLNEDVSSESEHESRQRLIRLCKHIVDSHNPSVMDEWESDCDYQ